MWYYKWEIRGEKDEMDSRETEPYSERKIWEKQGSDFRM
jgi:hypothetical protein